MSDAGLTGMTVRHLQYFVEVARERNFTRAAARLHVAQQGVSEQVRQLERLLGVRLLDRSSRRVELTSAGAAFFVEAATLLTRLDHAAEQARTLHREESGLLRVGFGEGAALTLTEPILDEVRARHPGIQLELRQFNYDDPSAGLSAGVVDVAFVRLPVDTAGLATERLFAEPVVLACAAGHQLAARASVRVSDVLAEPMLGSSTGDAVWNGFWQLEQFRAGRQRRSCRGRPHCSRRWPR
ncbi:LysR family transcriptional regulator [Rhodococcus sp. MTM3W5.2]|uniref:LysR family transcriptional regulator n=1 Tax=Rhodococcus sp. MTM3W5.2 TaxID=1805827 RepID=UPI0009F96383|nr:LysR substrate-binding domain-containing protein [Rhodococcus sp. MTM3W5.2]